MKSNLKFINVLVLVLTITIIGCSNDDQDNNNITAQDLVVSIDENPTNNQSIGSIQVSGNGTLSYSIISQVPSGALNINSITGELSVADATLFNYEEYQTISAVISVNNTTNTATSSVTINIVNINEIGDYNHGGVVFWIDPTDNTKGLVCAITDQSSSIRWHNTQQPSITGMTSTNIQTGSTNTDLIIASLGNSYAAGVARAYNGGGFTDWFLPSVDELKEMANNRAEIDATAAANSGTSLVAEPANVSNGYWSSSQQSNGGSVYLVNLLTAGENGGFAINFASVRAVRTFE
ncbi:hypothetical protein [Flavobacterium sp.]|uniref:hypothetical protein n=1 Tax=Flavobacterium sp. TaxID=239 RepID=UPI003D2A8208